MCALLMMMSLTAGMKAASALVHTWRQYLVDGVIDSAHSGSISNSVSNADGHAMLQQPVVGEVLALAQEGSGCFGAMLHHDDVDQGAS